MSVPNKLSRKLHETLGDEPGSAMTDWMDSVESHHKELRDESRADIAELRQEMHVQFANVREEMRVGFARVNAEFARVEASAAVRHAEMLRWLVGVWVVSLAAVGGALVGVVRALR